MIKWWTVLIERLSIAFLGYCVPNNYYHNCDDDSDPQDGDDDDKDPSNSDDDNDPHREKDDDEP